MEHLSRGRFFFRYFIVVLFPFFCGCSLEAEIAGIKSDPLTISPSPSMPGIGNTDNITEEKLFVSAEVVVTEAGDQGFEVQGTLSESPAAAVLFGDWKVEDAVFQ
ncbi:hypothetical protein [Bdellovibrio bacteriovorus]|uniref:hypothetical protein n=1 Tax=Bdellovibrio bacteriovorus TaxID=959 RepID=UPI0011D28EFD|nr:hypothetical protein [Bdellovibrio bacteriovorus]